MPATLWKKIGSSAWNILLIAGIGFGLAAGARLYAVNAQKNSDKLRASAKVAASAPAESRPASPLTESAKQVDSVKIWRVFPIPLIDTLKLPGTLEAYEDVDLAAKMAGNVDWLGPHEGDRVKAGEKLLELDTDSLQAEVERAQANVELAQANFDRISSLFEKKVASKEEFDSNRTALKTAKAALAEATARINDGTLHSPIDGVLDRRHVDRGEHISAGQNVLKIVDIDRVKVLVNIPEKDALYFKRGQKAKVFVGESQDKFLEGTIEWMALTADDASKTYPLKLVVENGEHLLRPGMIVQVQLVRRELSQAIAVPFFTIIDRQDSKAVFVVQNGIAVEKPIQYGIFQDGLVEIKEGISAGNQLVVVGQRNLVNGEKVSVAQDLTELARGFLQSGGDLSKLAMEYQP